MLSRILLALLLTRSVSAAEPRLVVLIVVDQLRGDEISTYESLWRKGMRRFLSEGRWYTQAFHEHAGTETAAGHATIATGLHPRWHGVVHKRMYVRDRAALVGVCEFGSGECDAEALLEPTVGDLLKTERPRAKVVAVASKARSANLLGGRAADNVVWIDGRTMTLRMRRDSAVLRQQFRDSMAQVVWTWELPPLSAPFHSRFDAAPGEHDEGHGVTFPHVLDATQGRPELAWFATPDVDRVTVDLALAAAADADLGGDDTPDLLLVSLSAVDGIGHAFGPDSLERAAAMVALDGQLERLLVGVERLAPGRVIVGLTADHGVAPTLAHARQQGYASDRVPLADLNATLNAALVDAGLSNALAAVWPPFVTLAPLPESQRQVALDVVVATLVAHPAIRSAWQTEGLKATDALTQLMAELCHSQRAGDVVFAWEPYHTEMHGEEGLLGAEHGTPWDYDRHVPVLLLGRGRGRTDTPVSVLDLSATLRQQLGLYADARGGTPLP